MRKLAWLCLLAPGFASAEEGLSVGRVTAGLAAAPGAFSTPLGALSARGDYHLFEHLGLTAGATWARRVRRSASGRGRSSCSSRPSGPASPSAPSRSG
jgi:hypothetical protein